MSDNGRQRLSSWKEIASHMGRDVRTVLRWEKQRGLPVHRAPGATGRVVFAYTDELDAWAKGADPATTATDPSPVAALPSDPAQLPSQAGWRRAAAATAVILVVAAVGSAGLTSRRFRSAATEVTKATLTDALVQAIGADGRILWTYPVDGLVNRPYSTTVVTDVNGDGHADVLASLIVRDSGSSGAGHLLALDHRGRKLWDRSIEDTLSFGRDSYTPTWAPDDLIAYQAGGQTFLAWAAHHHTWWPSIMAVFNGRGERTATFVNSGWIRNVVASPDGRYLIAGGISNSWKGAFFAILDPKQPSGTSPEEPGSPYECHDCPRGVPIRYYVVPWTDILDAKELGGRRGQPTAFKDGSIELRAVQYQNAEMIVELTPWLEIKRRRFSDGFWERHAQLERDGTLKHSRDACPFRNGPTVLEWMPERGWRELKPEDR